MSSPSHEAKIVCMGTGQSATPSNTVLLLTERNCNQKSKNILWCCSCAQTDSIDGKLSKKFRGTVLLMINRTKFLFWLGFSTTSRKG